MNDANSRQVTGASPNPGGWPHFSDAASALQVSVLGGRLQGKNDAGARIEHEDCMTDPNLQQSVSPEDPWMTCMRRGEFARAWELSDRVLAARETPCWHLPRHEQYIWDGPPFDARDVLVRCYHGLGDTVQFARYLPWLRARARRLTVWVQAPLIPLVGTIDPAIESCPKGIDRCSAHFPARHTIPTRSRSAAGSCARGTWMYGIALGTVRALEAQLTEPHAQMTSTPQPRRIASP